MNKELNILNESAIKIRHRNAIILQQVYDTYHQQETEQNTDKEENKSAILATLTGFLVCAFFIAYWIVFGY